MEIKRVEKPWGHELWWAHTNLYVGKLLHMKAGHRLSLQYHVKKDETVHLQSGELVLVIDEGAGLVEKHLRPGESHRIVPGTVHRMVAVTDCDVLEVSTPEVDDVVRIEDSYGRAEGRTATGEQMTQEELSARLESLGWIRQPLAPRQGYIRYKHPWRNIASVYADENGTLGCASDRTVDVLAELAPPSDRYPNGHGHWSGANLTRLLARLRGW
jgi:mannose-6-phosphate isomerase